MELQKYRLTPNLWRTFRLNSWRFAALQVVVESDSGKAMQSAVTICPASLAAGRAAELRLTARDAFGNLAVGDNAVEIWADSPAEGEAIMFVCP